MRRELDRDRGDRVTGEDEERYLRHCRTGSGGGRHRLCPTIGVLAGIIWDDNRPTELLKDTLELFER